MNFLKLLVLANCRPCIVFFIARSIKTTMVQTRRQLEQQQQEKQPSTSQKNSSASKTPTKSNPASVASADVDEDDSMRLEIEALVEHTVLRFLSSDAKLQQFMPNSWSKFDSDNAIVEGLFKLIEIIQTSTTSMTNVPKPLKFLSKFYWPLHDAFNRLWSFSGAEKLVGSGASKAKSANGVLGVLIGLAGVLSVVSMSIPPTAQRPKPEHEDAVSPTEKQTVAESQADTESKQYRLCLKYRILANLLIKHMVNPSEKFSSSTRVESWGHEYTRHLAMECMQEYMLRFGSGADEDFDGSQQVSADSTGAQLATSSSPDASTVDDYVSTKFHPEKQSLLELGVEMTKFFLKNNAEPDACDLMLELESVGHAMSSNVDTLVDDGSSNVSLEQLVDENSFKRVCLYLMSCSQYLPYPEDLLSLRCCHWLYEKYDCLMEALILALKLDDSQLINQDFKLALDKAKSNLKKKTKTGKEKSLEPSYHLIELRQMAFLICRHCGGGIDSEEQKSSGLDEKLIEEADKLISTALGASNSNTMNISTILCNQHLSPNYVWMARELDVWQPKHPEDVFKQHLENHGRRFGSSASSGGQNSGLHSAQHNLASSFVNGLLNFGFGTDKLMTGIGGTGEEGDEDAAGGGHQSWIYKNKDDGMLCAAASLGWIMMWDVEMGLTQLDKYLYSTNEYIKAGALLGIGVVQSRVSSDSDPALALLTDYVTGESEPDGSGKQNAPTHRQLRFKSSAIFGLGLAYAGTKRQDVAELLLPIITDPELDMQVCGLAALSLGLVFCGGAARTAASNRSKAVDLAGGSGPSKNNSMDQDNSGDDLVGEYTSVILQTLLERSNIHLQSPFACLMVLGLSLMFLGAGEESADACLETLKVLSDDNDDGIGKGLSELAQVMVEGLANAGSGNVLKIQQMLYKCNQELVETSSGASGSQKPPAAQQKAEAEETEPGSKVVNDMYQAMAVLSISLIAMGEHVGHQMAQRSFNHLMHYGESGIRRAVPLALGLLCASNPQMSVVDILSKYSHDSDPKVAMNAIFAMGLVGAGTNNARLAQMFRQLASFYHRDQNGMLYTVRISQGLLHMGKGLLSLDPFHTNRLLMSPSACGGLVAVLVSLLVSETSSLSTGSQDSNNLIFGGSGSKGSTGGKYPWLLYLLTPAIYPRFLISLDHKKLQPCQVQVRVGQAVDTVGQAGRPKTLTGFQTHHTPVLLAHGERAELVQQHPISTSTTENKDETKVEAWESKFMPILEGFVLVSPAETESEVQEQTAKSSSSSK